MHVGMLLCFAFACMSCVRCSTRSQHHSLSIQDQDQDRLIDWQQCQVTTLTFALLLTPRMFSNFHVSFLLAALCLLPAKTMSTRSWGLIKVPTRAQQLDRTWTEEFSADWSMGWTANQSALRAQDLRARRWRRGIGSGANLRRVALRRRAADLRHPRGTRRWCYSQLSSWRWKFQAKE
jgi:hypothetical protein